MRDALVAYLRRRGIGDDEARDIAQTTMSDVTLRMTEDRNPPSWFEERGAPGERDAQRFHSLVWTILRRRYFDEIRERYRQVLQTYPAPAPTSAVGHLEARELLGRLAAAILELPPRDREFLDRAMGAERAALSSNERVRLQRMRNALRRKVTR